MAEKARMLVELRESVQHTYAKSIQMRPTNTQRAFTKHQKEFRDWCAFSILTRFTVTGEKFHLFLEEINSHPSPRYAAVTALLKLTEYDEDERKRKNLEDHGSDSLL
ncbi:putative centromere DNA-binding protein complex CBF3 subunit domain-containing protein, partial [Phytophthora infestans]